MESKKKNKIHSQNKIINEQQNQSQNETQNKKEKEKEIQNKKEKEVQNKKEKEIQNKKEKEKEIQNKKEKEKEIQNKKEKETPNKKEKETQNQNKKKTESEKENGNNFISTRMSFFKPIGFENSLKENNCFVSVVFHALFHFTKLKDSLITLNISSPKLIVEIISLLSSYQKLNKDNKNLDNIILNPENFRNELEKVTKKKDFKKNEQGDPIELLNFLFNCLHEFMISKKSFNLLLDQKNNNIYDCLIHELFYINIKEISICKDCKFEKSLKYDLNYFMQFLNVDSILNNIKNKNKFNDLNGKLFKYAKIFTTQSSKCEKCSKENIKNHIVCDSIGKYFIINLGYDKSDLKIEDLCYLYIMIGREFNVKDLYDYKKDTKLYFLGMILYWSAHYICLFFSPNLEQFILYDDKIIKKFSSWKDIMSNFTLNKYQPVALLYGEYEENKLKKLPLFDTDETFYNNILDKAKKIDKEEINNKNLENLAIDENEWICNFCTCINNMNNDTCTVCGNVNNTIKELNQIKYEELKKINSNLLSKEERDFINYMEAKNNNLFNVDTIKKWVCQACGCNTNLEIDNICKMCGTKCSNLNLNNNKNDDIKKYDKNNNNHILDDFGYDETFKLNNKNNDVIRNDNQINNKSNNKNDKNEKNKKESKDKKNKNKNNSTNEKNNKNQNIEKWICKNCGNSNENSLNYCINCYVSRDKNKIICYVCENSDIKNGKCQKCKNDTEWTCQNCKKVYSLNIKKCEKCGKSINKN